MTLIKILSHPVAQAVSFCSIIISGPYFGGPYGFYLFRAIQQGYVFAIIGVVALIVTLARMFIDRAYIQLAGVLLMLISLAVYFTPPNGKHSYDGFAQIIPLITMILFAIIIILVIKTNLSKWKKNA